MSEELSCVHESYLITQQIVQTQLTEMGVQCDHLALNLKDLESHPSDYSPRYIEVIRQEAQRAFERHRMVADLWHRYQESLKKLLLHLGEDATKENNEECLKIIHDFVSRSERCQRDIQKNLSAARRRRARSMMNKSMSVSLVQDSKSNAEQSTNDSSCVTISPPKLALTNSCPDLRSHLQKCMEQRRHSIVMDEC
uniref:FH2 domain-containing protein n=1 Tax=Percolomonas cosmopolitus TaxID=63605 RepID=A0A7S1KN97_9EUKA